MGYATKTLIEDIFRNQPDYAGISVFVETGTYKCNSILGMAPLFRELHTIELAKELYDQAVKKCEGKGINLHHGDSAKILPVVARQIKEPVIFYLDAHWFVDPEVTKENPFPLWDEMRAILSRKMKDIIVVDDVHAFGRTHDPKGQPDLCAWSQVSVQSLTDFVGDRLVHWFFHVKGDCIVIYLGEGHE